jgi:hypothetical protein
MVADDAAYREMRRQARALYEERFTDRTNYQLLMTIYRRVSAASVARNTCERAEFA